MSLTADRRPLGFLGPAATMLRSGPGGGQVVGRSDPRSPDKYGAGLERRRGWRPSPRPLEAWTAMITPRQLGRDLRRRAIRRRLSRLVSGCRLPRWPERWLISQPSSVTGWELAAAFRATRARNLTIGRLATARRAAGSKIASATIRLRAGLSSGCPVRSPNRLTMLGSLPARAVPSVRPACRSPRPCSRTAERRHGVHRRGDLGVAEVVELERRPPQPDVVGTRRTSVRRVDRSGAGKAVGDVARQVWRLSRA